MFRRALKSKGLLSSREAVVDGVDLPELIGSLELSKDDGKALCEMVGA